MPLYDLNSVNQEIQKNPYLGKSREEIAAIKENLKAQIAQKRKEQLMSSVNTGIQGVGDIFLQRGGITPPKAPEPSVADSINEFIAKERLKQQIANEAPLSATDKLNQLKLDEINRRRLNAPTGTTENIPVSASQDNAITSAIENQLSGQQPSNVSESGVKVVNGIRYIQEPSSEFDEFGIPKPGKWIQDPSQALERESAQKAKDEEAKTILEDEKQFQVMKDSAQENLNTIKEVKQGLKYFGPYANIPTFITSVGGNIDYAARKKWENNVNKLISQKWLDTIIKLKTASKNGASGLGSLTEREGVRLERAATALSKDLAPQDALIMLNDMEMGINKMLKGKSQDDTVINQLLDQLGAD